MCLFLQQGRNVIMIWHNCVINFSYYISCIYFFFLAPWALYLLNELNNEQRTMNNERYRWQFLHELFFAIHMKTMRRIEPALLGFSSPQAILMNQWDPASSCESARSKTKVELKLKRWKVEAILFSTLPFSLLFSLRFHFLADLEWDSNHLPPGQNGPSDPRALDRSTISTPYYISSM
jgi:hypothetical protein